MQALHDQVAFASISIDLEDEAPAAAAAGSPAAAIRDSWLAALQSMQTFTIALVGGMLWGVAFAPYVLGLALVVWIVAIRLRRP